MRYFVTGGTGLIGRFLVKHLLERGGDVRLLVRKGSEHKLPALQEFWGEHDGDITPVFGDITNRGVLDDSEQVGDLAGTIDHFFHLAAIYDIGVDDDRAEVINVEGTRNVVELANDLGGELMFHHVSSIAVAGDHEGFFREDFFDEEQSFSNPYYRTKFQSEKVVREDIEVPLRVYRPGVVIGSSETGETDKIDGPYYFFKLIQKCRDMLPKWVPLVGLEGNKIHLAPVDYVAAAMDHIAHQEDLDEMCFHLVDPDPKSIGDTANEFCRAAHAPEMAMRVDSRLFNFMPTGMVKNLTSLPMIQQVLDEAANTVGVPKELFGQMNFNCTFDDRNTQLALRGSGIACPPLEDYAWKVWDYWERHLDPELHIAERFGPKVEGKVAVVTGASSGIGAVVAKRLGEAGAKVVVLARRAEKLEEVCQDIENMGGEAYPYPCDLTNFENVDEVVDQIVADLGGLDIVINNAGRSIRRSVFESLDRFHDFQRTMELNYFGALRMIMRSLPHMREQGSGHIVNISSIGVLSNAPRFSAYVASKAALDAFSRCIAAEVKDAGIDISTVYMPLVRTPMIKPTKIYQFFPALTPDEAGDLVVEALVTRPKRIATPLGKFADVMYSLAPKVNDAILNVGYRMFPSSQKAKGDDEKKEELSPEGVAFAYLLRGIHW
jgi:NAD(P)-dependent dehydrogenase (short-subunit alcohol dehydrogenase family)